MNKLLGLVCLVMGVDSAAPSGDVSLINKAVTKLLAPAIGYSIRRQPISKFVSPMYSRLTQTPMIWIHLRKAAPILVDKEFYNISAVPGMNVTNVTEVVQKMMQPKLNPIPTLQQIIPHGSLLESHHKADPVMIENGLFVTMPLRQPPQETFNIAAVENTRTVQGVADYRRKKRETRALIDRFNSVLKQFRGG